MNVHAIVNPGAGSLLNVDAQAFRENLATSFTRHNVTLHVHPVGGEEIAATVSEAIAQGAELIVAVGGDGTINTVARALNGGRIPLGVIAMGTLNLFARDMSIPLTVDEAVDVIATGEVRFVDTASVNDRVFLLHSALGLHPKIVREREEIGYNSRWQKLWALSLAILRVTLRNPSRRLVITTDGMSLKRVTPLVIVSPHAFTLDRGVVTRVSSREEGRLMISIGEWDGILETLVLACRELLGIRTHEEGFSFIRAGWARIESRRRALAVSLDGEIEMLSTPIEYRVLPASLPVKVPRVSDNGLQSTPTEGNTASENST